MKKTYKLFIASILFLLILTIGQSCYAADLQTEIKNWCLNEAGIKLIQADSLYEWITGRSNSKLDEGTGKSCNNFNDETGFLEFSVNGTTYKVLQLIVYVNDEENGEDGEAKEENKVIMSNYNDWYATFWTKNTVDAEDRGYFNHKDAVLISFDIANMKEDILVKLYYDKNEGKLVETKPTSTETGADTQAGDENMSGENNKELNDKKDAVEKQSEEETKTSYEPVEVLVTGSTAGGGTLENPLDNTTLESNAYKPSEESSLSESNLDIPGRIVGTINTIGVILSVIVLTILGVKYMLGSVEEKAEYKETLKPYLIGVFMLVAGTTILNVLYNLGKMIL